jgi:hypothetical protein
MDALMTLQRGLDQRRLVGAVDVGYEMDFQAVGHSVVDGVDGFQNPLPR